MLPRKFYFDDFIDSLMESDKSSSMLSDIYEKDGNYIIEMDLPGFSKENIKLECNKGNVIITAEKSSEKEDKDKKYLRKERTYGKYSRSFYLGDIDQDNINANFKNGTLKITIPKIDEENNKKYIDID